MEVWGGGGEQVVRISKDFKKKKIVLKKNQISQVDEFSTFLCID